MLKLSSIITFVLMIFLNFESIITGSPCLDETSTRCYIKDAHLTKDDSAFRPVSASPLNVMTLIVESSTIPHLSNEICKAFPNLRKFDAQKAMIEVVDEDTFHECTNLDYIDLGQNKIRKLGKNTFNHNKELEVLSLHDNNLESLHKDLFMGLSNMWRLVLSINDLTEVPVILFRDLSRLRELTLHHNRLTDLDAEQLVKYCPHLSMIHLRDNDFRCDRLTKILEAFKEENVGFWDYADKLRTRNYTVEFVNGTECLNDVQYNMEMKTRKNFTRTVFDMENQIKI